MEDILLMKKIDEIMDIIQEPMEWMSIGFFIATIFFATVIKW